MIRAESLTRTFRTSARAPGLRPALGDLLRRRQTTVTAIRDVSFTVEPGRIVGFLGPNGSGKTTTLKCLAGLLTPTAGRVEVLGHTPSRREPEFLRELGFVMGQRWQLHVDLPVRESFELHRVVYDLDRREFARTRDELAELLELGDLVRRPARTLSLGERMRCEFAAALLHRPRVVLLDEPTLGLDFEAQLQVRRFVPGYVRLTGAAVILTSHYLADIEAMAQDVMTISHGRITFRGSLRVLQQLAGEQKLVTAQLTHPVPVAAVRRLGTVVEHGDAKLVLQVPRGGCGHAVSELERLAGVADVSLTDPPLEETLRGLYAAVPA